MYHCFGGANEQAFNLLPRFNTKWLITICVNSKRVTIEGPADVSRQNLYDEHVPDGFSMGKLRVFPPRNFVLKDIWKMYLAPLAIFGSPLASKVTGSFNSSIAATADSLAIGQKRQGSTLSDHVMHGNTQLHGAESCRLSIERNRSGLPSGSGDKLRFGGLATVEPVIADSVGGGGSDMHGVRNM